MASSSSSGYPKAPAAVHHSDPEAGLSYAEPETSDQHAGKRPLKTMGDVKQEWRTGSRKRVIRQYVVSTLIGFLVGGIIGMIIGLAIRYS